MRRAPFVLVTLAGCGAAALVPGAETETDAATAPAADGASTAPETVHTAAVDGSRAPDGSAKDAPRRDVALAPDAYFGESRCPANVMFCEDFEGNALDPAKWTTEFVGSSMSFDTMSFARGKSSLRLKISVPSGSSLAHVNTKRAFPVLAGASLWVRVFYYVDAVMPDRWFWILAVPGDGQNGFGLGLIPYKEGRAVYYWVGSGGTVQSGQLAAVGAWACYELELRGQSEVHLYVNGDEIPDMAAKGWPALKQTGISFKLELNHDDIIKHTDGFNSRIDSVAISNERVGCAK